MRPFEVCGPDLALYTELNDTMLNSINVFIGLGQQANASNAGAEPASQQRLCASMPLVHPMEGDDSVWRQHVILNSCSSRYQRTRKSLESYAAGQ
jgi:hypothetical protein